MENGLNSTGTGLGPVAGSCKQGNEHSVSTKVREHFRHQLSVSQELVRLDVLINSTMQGLRSGADSYSDCKKKASLFV